MSPSVPFALLGEPAGKYLVSSGVLSAQGGPRQRVGRCTHPAALEYGRIDVRVFRGSRSLGFRPFRAWRERNGELGRERPQIGAPPFLMVFGLVGRK